MCGMYAGGEYIDRSEVFDDAMFDGNTIEFNSDGTGTLVRTGEDPETFSYSSDAEILFFADGREVFFSFESGVVTVYFDDGTTCYPKDGYNSSDYVPAVLQGEFGSEFAGLYAGDWHGMAECYQCTGNFADRNDSQYEIIARFVFDEYGNCIPYLAIALSGQNEYNFTDISVSHHPDDGEGEYMPLSGTFMKLDIDSDESFVQIDPDYSDRMYVNIMLEDSDGSVYQAFACMRPVGDDYYDNDEDSGNSGETAGVIDDMGKGYGKSNAYATGTATLELMRKVYAEWTEPEKLTYEVVSGIFGSDGIPWYDTDSTWSENIHSYKWADANGKFLYISFKLDGDTEFFNSCTYSHNVKEGV